MHFTTLFIWFFLYSILGWIYETIYCSIKNLKWDNRGMLLGPYCPIYGIGAILDVLLCGRLPSSSAVFFTCMLGSAILEYTTSYVTDRLFHAVWWDYSNIPLNIHGRICLPCSLGFGAAGLLVLYGIHPYMTRFTQHIPLYWQELAALAFMAVFASDCALTADSLTALNVKLEATRQAIDSQIAEKYDAFIKNTRQNLKISLEEYRERRTLEELKKVLSTMNWAQTRVLRSPVSFRQSSYGGLGGKMRQHFLFHKKTETEDKAKPTL